MKTVPLSNSPKNQSSSSNDTALPDPLDGAVSKLVVQAAFVQAFAENLADMEIPAERVAPAGSGGEIDFGWRAGLRL